MKTSHRPAARADDDRHARAILKSCDRLHVKIDALTARIRRIECALSDDEGHIVYAGNPTLGVNPNGR